MSPLPPLKPGDLPRPQTARERRAELAAFDEEARNPPNQRPNEVDDPLEDRCPQSKYQRHRFVVARGRTVCEFCFKPERGGL